jgi:histone deacetylase complex regulatory component SIN3
MLKRYSSKEVTFAEVSKKVAELFHDHPQLIAQFGSFLDRDRANTLKKASDSKKSVCIDLISVDLLSFF